MRFETVLPALRAVASVSAYAMPFRGAKESSPVDTSLAVLTPGEFIREGDVEPESQRRPYRHLQGDFRQAGQRNADRRVHDSEQGPPLEHLQRRRDAALGAPHPGRVALPAGGLPGYPASHGCVHLPSEFARLLFDITHVGTTVVISAAPSEPPQMAHPSVPIPIDAGTGAAIPAHPLAPADACRREPKRSTDGPVTLAVSGSDERMVVLRNGTEVGRSRVRERNPERPAGTHAWTLLGTDKNGDSQWQATGMHGHAGESGGEHDQDALARIALPPQLVVELIRVPGRGATMMLTDAPVLHHTTGSRLPVMGSGLSPGAPAAAGGGPAPD